MQTLVAILLVLAVVFAVLRASGVSLGRLDPGWLSISCVIAALAMIPALLALP